MPSGATSSFVGVAKMLWLEQSSRSATLTGAEELLAPVLERIDAPQARARLADAVADLHAAGRIDPLLAAAAHIDLDSDSELLITASLIHAAALAAGATRTPGGLLLAA